MILSKKSYQPRKLFVDNFTTHESYQAELIELTIHKELSFSKHFDKLCRKAQNKLHSLRQKR